MSTTSSSPSSTNLPVFSAGQPQRSRPLVIVLWLAFLALLRRDLLIARRGFIGNLIQSMIIPALFLFIFGKVLPQTGVAVASYSALLLPGMISLTLLMTALMNVTLPLVLDIGNEREIEDRLLAPVPTALVALEKVLFAALYAFITTLFVFPVAYLILGSDFHMRWDAIGLLIGIMLLSALAGASLGLTLGTAVQPEQIGVLNAVILMPLIFLGCIYFSWSALSSLRWFQIVTLFNPLTYASEGIRAAMTPGLHGLPPDTMAIPWVLLGLIVTTVLFLTLGIRGFMRRAVS